MSSTRNIAVVLSANASTFRGQMAQASAAVRSFDKDVDRTASTGSKMATGLKIAFAAVAVAAAAFLFNGIRQAVQFEAAMRNVNSISKLSEESLGALSDQVLTLSTRLPQSAQTLAEGLYEIASSGFQGAEGMKILEAAGVAASAGLSTTEVSAKALTAVLNAYGLEANDVTDVSDVLFQTVNLGVVSFEELASELGDVVGGAAAAGIAIDEVGAAVAAMTLSGISAAESTTSLNRLITSLIDPSDALKTKFKELGYESGKSALDQLGLYGTMELLRESTGGNIETLLQLFPEIRAARGAFALMSADGKNYANTFAGIADETARAGATQAAYDEQMKAVGNQWKLFTNQVSVAGIRLGTWFLPILADGIKGMQTLGSSVGDLAASIGRAAAPAWDSLTDAARASLRVLDSIMEVVGPVAKGLGMMVGGAVIVGINALAEGLQQMAEFLADNEGLVKGLAIVIGGLLVAKLAAAVAQLVKFHAQFRALLVMETLGPILSNLAGRVGLFAQGLYGLFSMGNIGNIGRMKDAFSGLGGVLTSPAVMGIAATAGVYALVTGFQNAERQAKQLREELEADIDFTSIDSIQAGIDTIRERLQAANQEVASYRSVGGVLKGVTEVLTPMSNGLQDAAAESRELAASLVEVDQAGINLWSATEQLAASLGLTKREATAMLAELDFNVLDWAGLSAADLAAKLGELVVDAEALQAANEGATPAQNGLNDAMASAADIAANAQERVDAFADAIDALVGIQLGAWDANTRFAESAQALTDTVTEGGIGFDQWTEAGRANRDALSENITAMTDLAVATANQSGNIEDGVSKLMEYRGGLIDQLEALGMNRTAAEELVNSMGLIPEEIETLLALNGADTAQQQLDTFDAHMKAVNDAKANPTVAIKSEDFNNDAIEIGRVLMEIEKANPEATVKLDGTEFHATSAQVQAWAAQWDDASPEANALLDIIDPQNKYGTLSEAAANWDAASTTGTALLDHSDAVAKFRETFGTLYGWNVAVGTGSANLDPSNARSGFSSVFDSLYGWDAASGAATANLNDNASGALANIQARLNVLNGQYAHVYVVTHEQRITAGPGGSGGVPVATGGIIPEYLAVGGVSKTVQYGPRGTDTVPAWLTPGEMVLNKNQQANLWNLIAQPQMGSAAGGMVAGATTISMVTHVSVKAEAGVDTKGLAKQIGKTVDEKMDDSFRRLRRSLKVG